MSLALRRASDVAFLAVAVIVVVAILGIRPVPMQSIGFYPLGRGGPGADVNPEAAEQGEQAEERREAFEQAVEQGEAGKPLAVAAAPAPGWAGEQLVEAAADDWEPALAADPRAPFVYLLTTRYGTTKPCPGNCPDPWIALEISADGGATWTDGVPLCACKGGGQFDPIIEVVPNTGWVYSVYMNGYNVVFVKSTDHGAHWTAPVKTYGNVSWNDKPVIAVSDDGRDVYVSFNGPTGGDPWLGRQQPLLLRLRRRRRVGRHRVLRTERDPLWRRREQGHDAVRDDRPSRLRLDRPRRALDRSPRRLRPARHRVRRRGVPAGLLPRPRRLLGRLGRRARLAVRRRLDRGRPADHHCAALDESGCHVDGTGHHLGDRLRGHIACR
jgi:hypothetical protein